MDAGYGLTDTAAFVRSIADLPVTLWLTHGHHDHAAGARWFEEARLHPAEADIYRTYAGQPWIRRVLLHGRESGIPVDEAAFLAAKMPAPVLLPGETLDLGGLTARIIPCPGHTPGSVVVYVPERELLLTGDDWNPCTWLFFPEALPVRDYRSNMRELLALPFRHLICPHRDELYPRAMLEAFLDGLTDAAIETALPVDTGDPYGVRTREVSLPEGQVLVFDAGKAGLI